MSSTDQNEPLLDVETVEDGQKYDNSKQVHFEEIGHLKIRKKIEKTKLCERPSFKAIFEELKGDAPDNNTPITSQNVLHTNPQRNLFTSQRHITSLNNITVPNFSSPLVNSLNNPGNNPNNDNLSKRKSSSEIQIEKLNPSLPSNYLELPQNDVKYVYSPNNFGQQDCSGQNQNLRAESVKSRNSSGENLNFDGNGSFESIGNNFDGNGTVMVAQQAAHKRQERLTKNKEAAKQCRLKKKEYIKCLETRVEVLENQNKALIHELKTLKDMYCGNKN